MSRVNKKKIIELIILLISILIVAISFFISNSSNASAQTIYGIEQYSNDEELLRKYTNTDSLKDEFGNSLSGNIEYFAQDVKSKIDGEEIKNLTKVIPEKYVRFVEDGYSFYYNGKEYGFFVNHRKMQARQFLPSGLGQTFPPYNSVPSEIDLAIYPRRCNT